MLERDFAADSGSRSRSRWLSSPRWRWARRWRAPRPAHTERVSVGPGGAQANDGSSSRRAVAVSANGRFVALSSRASKLVAGDTNAATDVFVHDRQLGTTERVSVATGGAQGTSHSSGAAISADGRFVAFSSLAPDLVVGDTNHAVDVFVRDRQAGTTERVSVASDGAQADERSSAPAISADGRFVAFSSVASTLGPGTDRESDMYLHNVFVHDRQTGLTDE